VTIHFPDVSHYQSGLSLTGAPAAFAKASQGNTYRDPAYAGFRSQAATLQIPFAAYHWVDGADLAAQARNAYGAAGTVPLMWDAEAAGATVPRLVDLTSRHRALGGNPRLVYLPHWWWENLGRPDLRPLARVGLSLVSSNYPAGGYTENGPGWAPYGGMTPVIWQWTDAHAFNGQRVDFNAFRGTVDQLRALLGLDPGGGTAVAGDGYTDKDRASATNLQDRVDGLWHDTPSLWDGAALAGDPTQNKNGLRLHLDRQDVVLARIEAKLDRLGQPAAGAGLTEAQIRAIVRGELDKTHLAGA
jgi:hypothetical protein